MRNELGATQKELAAFSDLDIRWIQKLESGEINMENVTVKKFLQLLKGLDELTQGKGKPQEPNTEVIQGAYHRLQEVFTLGGEAHE